MFTKPMTTTARTFILQKNSISTFNILRQFLKNKAEIGG